jgi:glycosyltransferase involved in cell wall biosynthesis
MACEVPVISSRAGGLPEVNLHGVTGYLSDVGDVDEMAMNAISLLKDPEKLSQFSKAALARAKEYDIDVIVPHYENYYLKVLEMTRARKDGVGVKN